MKSKNIKKVKWTKSFNRYHLKLMNEGWLIIKYIAD
jgi:hypothetical protein